MEIHKIQKYGETKTLNLKPKKKKKEGDSNYQISLVGADWL